LDPQLAAPNREAYQLTVTRPWFPSWRLNRWAPFTPCKPSCSCSPRYLREACIEGVEWVIPCLQIKDHPRFGWRGLMLDCGRYFMPKEFLRTDRPARPAQNERLPLAPYRDQGWRIEIKKYPRLTEVGAWRKETSKGTLK